MTSWATLPTHQSWLQDETSRLLSFGVRCGLAAGGAAYLDDTGRPDADQPVQTYITARMVHVYAAGQLLGVPGCRPVAQQALAGLQGRLRDPINGGWFVSIDDAGPIDATKSCYEHAFVMLAATSAVQADLPGAEELLTESTDVFDRWFWDETAGLCVDSWDCGFTTLDGYRGLNANMHAVEAMLAVADVTGDRLWLERAARIAAFVVHHARQHDWRIPEHYNALWQPLTAYNADRRDDPFKPYGATVGHALEWSRLLLNLEAAAAVGSVATAEDWSGASRALFGQAVADGWGVDRADGFIYTTDWDGTPIVRDRMHWVLAEAIAAAAALSIRTGDPAYAALYARWWDHAELVVLDREHGSWHHQMDAANQPISTIWPGKPDLYHALQATLIPRLPLAPTLATALHRALLRSGATPQG